MKKLLAILGVITCMVGLCACGQEETADTSAYEGLLATCESMIDAMGEIVEMGPAAVEQYTVDPVFYAGLQSLQSAMEDIGEFQGTNGSTVSENSDGVIVEVNILGSKHNAVAEFVLSDTLVECYSITTNVTYSFGELMTKAFLNTVIGMGTVFIVLIFISLIISCFGLFAKVGDKKQEKATETTSEKAAADPVVAQIAEKEELAGDTELVAVIAAAIAAYEGSGSTDGFVVRSIRKSNKSKWQNA